MKSIVPSAAALLLLAACGGGSDDPAPPPAGPAPDPTAQVPPSANDSSSGLIAYLNSLLGASANEKEPVSLDDFNPQTPDASEPDVVS